ncbi:hypothetical protein hrd7_10450 [Leptolinea sp. HRD-7]|nr:hypothetical protein hrd7_10450 [Leptolinea sp. HRD-7]
MKILRLSLLCFIVLVFSLSCKAVTGLLTGNEETIISQQTDETLPIPQPGGLITRVTLALGSEPETYNPVNPATEFLPTDTIHAIVAVKKAPADTLFSARWVTTRVDLEDRDNTVINTTEIQTGGSGNLDFTLTPDGEFPTGSYRVEIYVNNKLDQLKTYKIVASGR